jgi:hypothetical protein
MEDEVRNYQICCDFCSKRKKFSGCKQVILKIDKSNNYQFLFAMMCSACQKQNMKTTIHGQTIKVVTSRNHNRDEKSLFDDAEMEM